jgi:hypothetical protein
LRADGQPAPGARVWLADPTLFAHKPGTRQETTALVPSRWTELATRNWPETVESVLSGRAVFEPAVADADGRFELRGLCRRSYELVACDPHTSQRSAATRVAAGAERVELHLRSDVHDKLSGNVVDRTGRAVAGASVAVETRLTELRWGDQIVFVQRHVRGAMRTGADGSFWLFDVPATGARVHVAGSGIVPLTLAPADLRGSIVVERRLPLAVHCADPDAVDSVGATDGDGHPVVLDRRQGSSNRRALRVPVLDGRTEVFLVPDTAVELVGYRGDEVRRRAKLLPGMREITW